jgi:PadR family transcriptional regulator, regulatory protein PadR
VFYIGYNPPVNDQPKLSHTSALILQAICCGCGLIKAIHTDWSSGVYGYSLMETTGLPSGTVYPALRRLERDGLISSHREKQSIADAGQRPPRKYYQLTAAGKTALQNSIKRYPLLARLIPSLSSERA